VKIIYSFYKEAGSLWNNQDRYAFISNALVKKLGYETTLYTTRSSAEFFKHIPFDNLEYFEEEEIATLPSTVWSKAKILTVSKMKEPFIHLDFDCFLFNNSFAEKIKNKKFFYFHKEPWELTDKNLEILNLILKSTHNGFFMDLVNLDPMSKNFACFGCQDAEYVPTVSNRAFTMLAYLKKYAQIFESNDFVREFESHGRNIVYLSVFIEQILFYNLCIQNLNPGEVGEITTNYNLGMENILKNFNTSSYCETGILHLWNHKHSKGVSPLIEKISDIIHKKM